MGFIKFPSIGLITLPQVAKKLVAMGVDGDLSQLVAGCLWVRREEVRSQLLRDSYKFSHTCLNDFDWKLKVNVATCWNRLRVVLLLSAQMLKYSSSSVVRAVSQLEWKKNVGSSPRRDINLFFKFHVHNRY